MKLTAFVLLSVFLACAPLAATDLTPVASITFQDEPTESTQLSGVTKHGPLLILCPDEGSKFDVFEESGANTYHRLRTDPLSDDSNDEIDLEGAASDGESVFMIGSHSLARSKVKPNEEYETNKTRQLDIKDDKHRDRLFRLKLGEHGKIKDKESVSLRKILHDDRLLGSFTSIPGKENGVDIEGIAVRDEKLFVGFRGPVLRENYAIVMSLKFDSPEDYKLSFLDLDGSGIRDLAAVKDGFLLIAGPVGDGSGPYQLCFWNGKDCLAGKHGAGGKVTVLGNIPAKEGEKAEGLAVLAEGDHDWTLLILYDGADRGGAKKFVVNKPAN